MSRALLVCLLLAAGWGLSPEPLRAQTREAQRAVELLLIDADDAVCQAAEALVRPAPPRRAMCFVGLARHPSGIRRVELNGSETVLEPRSAGETRFVGFIPATALARDVEVVAYPTSGQGIMHVYGMVAPGDGQTTGGRLALKRTAAAAPLVERTVVAGAEDRPAAAAPAPAPARPSTEYLTLAILEPAEWRVGGTQTIRVPPGDTLRVVGRTQHPSGVSRVTVNGREVRLQPHASGAMQFSTFVVAGAAQTGVTVVAYPRRGEPQTKAFRISPTPQVRSSNRTSSREDVLVSSAGEFVLGGWQSRIALGSQVRPSGDL